MCNFCKVRLKLCLAPLLTAQNTCFPKVTEWGLQVIYANCYFSLKGSLREGCLPDFCFCLENLT